VVSRKVSKSAVVRNRIRRRIYEYVRILSTEFTVPIDFAIIVYDEKVAKIPTEQLRHDLMKLCQKAGAVPLQTALHAIVEPKE
jgi:ribonuclease P protein component